MPIEKARKSVFTEDVIIDKTVDDVNIGSNKDVKTQRRDAFEARLHSEGWKEAIRENPRALAWC
jgi:hypothetical protein